jgi:drug/metabolite transporter (DMT)-like permease
MEDRVSQHTSLAAAAIPGAGGRLAGLLFGFAAASIAGLYTVFARYGISHGLVASDMTFLRFGVAGVITIPTLVVLLRRQRARLYEQWRTWLSAAVFAGPLFGILMFSGLRFAPASHAAVLPFSAMSVVGTLLSVGFLGDRLTMRKIVGIGVVIAGLVVLSGVGGTTWSGGALFGDVLFIVAGTLWAAFGIVMKKHRLDAWTATAIISAFALITYVPAYLLMTGGHSLRVAPVSLVALEVLVQGVLGGAGTLYTYSKAVELLGASRAAVFPALAPGLATFLAWPVLGHHPAALELLGLVAVICGLIVAVTSRQRG